MKIMFEENIIIKDQMYKCQICGVTLEKEEENKSLFRILDCHLMTEHGEVILK